MRIILLSFLICSFQLDAQTYFNTFGGINDDQRNFIQEDSIGNFIVCGDSGRTQNSAYDSQLLLLKADAFGNILWVKTYGDTMKQAARCVRQTFDGGYILNGYDDALVLYDCESLLLKTDSIGDSLWSKQDYSANDFRVGISVLQLPDSSLVSSSYADGQQFYNPYQLMKSDKQGNNLWSHYTDAIYASASGPTNFSGSSLIYTYDHSFVVAGTHPDNSNGYTNIYCTKLDSTGQLIWTKYFGDTLYWFGSSVYQTSDSGYIICGYTNDSTIGGFDILFMKLDSNGDSLWSKRFGGGGNDYLSASEQTGDGGYILFGYSNSFSSDYNLLLLRLDANGDSLWQQTFGGSNDEILTHGIICHDGGFAMTGSTKSYGAGQEDVFILKTDSLGNLATKISDVVRPNIRIYPNPVSNNLQISLIDNTSGKIYIYI
jgi:hypothetical protein